MNTERPIFDAPIKEGGYRRLFPDELVDSLDQYFSATELKWIVTNFSTKDKILAGRTSYRRPITWKTRLKSRMAKITSFF